MLFITDLDKTIVYSGYPEHYCIEYKGNQEITYITKEAKRLLNELFKQEQFRLIPCTLRSYKQAIRIEFITDILTPIIICDNGFSIYRNGILDKNWDMKMQSHLLKYPMLKTYNIINDNVNKNNIQDCQIKSNRDSFYTIIFKNKTDADCYSSKIINNVDLSLYKIEKQGRKVYVIPYFLDKVLALKYIKELYPKETVITAGDSSVDTAFIKEGEIAILPNHSKLDIDYVIRTKSNGINAGKEILEIINNIIFNQNH